MIPPQPPQYLAYRQSQRRVHIATVEPSWTDLARDHPHLVLLRPSYVGICSADIRELQGQRPGRSDFGHEVVGTILDSTHPQFGRGDAVIMNPFIKIERETAFAQTMYLAGSDEQLRSALLKVPTDEMRFAIAEPLACAIHAARQSRRQGREPALILGAGFFGYLLYCYLDSNNVPVRLANRSPDRIAELVQRVPSLQGIADLEHCGSDFSTVFLMQSRLSEEDIATAAHLTQEEGEIVLFGAIDQGKDPELHTVRNLQKRVRRSQQGRGFYLQGTLDASLADLQEAIATLNRPEFSRALTPILAEPLTFEQGAQHLTQRAASPRSYLKYLVEPRR